MPGQAKTKVPPSQRGESAVDQKYPFFFAWTFFSFSEVTGYASHSVTCGVKAGDQAALPHDPLPSPLPRGGHSPSFYW